MSEIEITNAAAQASPDVNVRVLKHRVATRIMHGIVALGFVVCAITGILLFAGVDFGRGGMAIAHCIMGLCFAVAPIVYIIFCWKNYARFMDTITHYDKDDLGWLKAPMGGYLDPIFWRGKPEHYVPPQDKYNTGQKGAGVCLILGSVALAVTGLLMWANTAEGIFGLVTIQLSSGMTWFLWTLHVAVAVLMLLIFVVHFFLGAVYPVTNVEFWTMFGRGFADYTYTKKKHGKWLNTLEVKEEHVVEDDDKKDA